MPVPLFNQVGTEKCDVALWWKLAWKPNIKFLLPPPKIQRRWLVFLVKCVTAYIRLWLVILWLWWVMLLIWLLLRSLVGYCCACGLLMWLCCCAIGDIHTGVKSGCKLVTLLSFLWYDKLWGPSQRVVTLFLWLAVESQIHLLKRQSSKSAGVCSPAYTIIMSPSESISG